MITKKKNVGVKTRANGAELRLEIEKRAYELWQADGGPHGNDVHYWLVAERDLTNRYTTLNTTHQTGIQS
jgi:hypothetical protein